MCASPRATGLARPPRLSLLSLNALISGPLRPTLLSISVSLPATFPILSAFVSPHRNPKTLLRLGMLGTEAPKRLWNSRLDVNWSLTDGTMLSKPRHSKILPLLKVKSCTRILHPCQRQLITKHPSPLTNQNMTTGESSAEAGPTHSSAGAKISM